MKSFMRRLSRAFLTVAILFAGVSVESVSAQSVQDKITVKSKNKSLESVLKTIENQTSYRFAYSPEVVDVSQLVTVDVKTSAIEEALSDFLPQLGLTYSIIGNQIMLKQRDDRIKKINIKGNVRDSDGEPLVGVVVAEKGLQMNATITDVEGNFELSAMPDAMIEFSCIGYKAKKVLSGHLLKSPRVVLHVETTSLDEVVVVGYGVQRKETLTGSVANMKGDALLTTKSPNLIQSMQGKLSGVQIRQSDSQPGASSTSINIRGFGAPLVVIDGVLRDGTDELQALDPNDIESISVLKDGAAAIYGIGAANGVLIVTTKQGRKGDMKVSFSGNIGFSTPTDIPRMATASEWIDLKNELNVNRWAGMAYEADEIQKYKEGVLPGYENVDWYGETMKTWATQHQYNLSVQGGSDVATYFVSMGYTRDNGLVVNNPLNYEQYTFRLNSGIELSKNLHLDVNISGRFDKNNQLGSGGFMEIYKGVMTAAPFQKPYINDDSRFPAYISSSATNPSVLVRPDLVGYNSSVTNIVRSSLNLVYDFPFVKGLKFKLFGAYDFNSSDNKVLQRQVKLYKEDSETGNPYEAATFSSDNLTNTKSDRQRLNFQGSVSYSREFAEAHNVSAMLLYEIRHTEYTSLNGKRYYDFYTTDVLDQAGMVDQSTGGSMDETANMSLVGRFNYDYKSKYLAEFIFRYDGTYRYNPDQRWGFFPGVSLGWRISEEDFVKRNASFINNLKLRASFGVTGQDAGEPFQYVEGYQTGSAYGYEFEDGVWTTMISSPLLVNRRLTWYTAQTYDVGLDVELWDGLFGLEFDLYRRDRHGILSRRSTSLPNTFGASLPQENLNSDRVQGIDFKVSHRNAIGAFYYAIDFNMNISQAMNLYVEQGAFQSSYSKWRYDSSYRNKNIIWGYDIIGYFESWEQIRNYPVYMEGEKGNSQQLPGDPIYRDVNGDGLITSADQVPMFYGGQVTIDNRADYSSGQPPLQYGLNLSAGWKGIDFNVLLQGAARYTIYIGAGWQIPLYSDRNAPAYLMDRWHLENPEDKDSAWIPGYFPASREAADAASLRYENSLYRRNASYLRVKNIELGYSLPDKFLKKIKMEKFRIYVNVYNALTFTDKILKMFDPERGEGNYGSNYSYPLNKSVNVGLNITF